MPLEPIRKPSQTLDIPCSKWGFRIGSWSLKSCRRDLMCKGAAFGRPFFGESKNFLAECHAPTNDWRHLSNIRLESEEINLLDERADAL